MSQYWLQDGSNGINWTSTQRIWPTDLIALHIGVSKWHYKNTLGLKNGQVAIRPIIGCYRNKSEGRAEQLAPHNLYEMTCVTGHYAYSYSEITVWIDSRPWLTTGTFDNFLVNNFAIDICFLQISINVYTDWNL